MKKCIACEIEKPLDAFNKNKGSRDGLQTYCRECQWKARHEGFKLAHRKVIKKSEIPSPVNGGKVCRMCLTEKDRAAYASDVTRQDALHPYCQECRHKQKRSPEALAKRRKLRKWTKDYAVKYHYDYTRRPEVMARNAARNRTYSLRFPEKAKAHSAVTRAMITGDIVRPRMCEGCFTACKPEAHHHKGYDKEHWLDVLWLCRSCHKKQHLKYPNEHP